MKIKEFDKLYLNNRIKLLWKYGEFIAQKGMYGSKVCLYSLNDFFVEVHYCPNSQNIIKVEPVKETNIFEHYLPDIKLERLFV